MKLHGQLHGIIIWEVVSLTACVVLHGPNLIAIAIYSYSYFCFCAVLINSYSS